MTASNGTDGSSSADEIVRDEYRRIGLTRDGLPYTLEFDKLHGRLCTRLRKQFSKPEAWRLLDKVLKKGSASGMRGGTRAPRLSEEQKHTLRDILPGPVSERDRWPYTVEFEAAREEFCDLFGVSLSCHEVWRAVCNIGKRGGGTTVQPSGGAEATVAAHEYKEARRATRERRFFARNAALARHAKEHYGCKCRACGFEYPPKYGELGEGYIECHHLSPLAERPECEWTDEVRTNLDQVTVLCANCHRMIHRHRPALSLDELLQAIQPPT